MPREEAERALESVDLAKTMLDDPVKTFPAANVSEWRCCGIFSFRQKCCYLTK